MAIRKSQGALSALGAALLLIGVVTGYFSLQAGLKHANLASGPGWHDPFPVTEWDRFWMNFPVRYVLLVGAAFLTVALIRALIAAVRQGHYYADVFGAFARDSSRRSAPSDAAPSTTEKPRAKSGSTSCGATSTTPSAPTR
jgi:TRAP-type C4-dicarboxylate transport system permease small subunit